MTTANTKLQRARLEKHWSVAVASRRVGVSTNTFNRWERGLQIPQLATLDQLLEAFEMSAEDLGFGFVVSPVSQSSRSAVCEGERTACVRTLSPVLWEREDAAPASISCVLNALPSVHVQPLIPSRQEIATEYLSRRQVMAALIGTPATIFGARQGDNLALLRVEEILTLCASHIPLCWQLYFEGGRAEVEKVLPAYIAQLATLACHASAYQKRAASLLSQAYQLASLLATQHQDYGVATSSARQGVVYGEMAEDVNLQVAALIRLALVSFFLKRSRSCLQTYQRAVPLIAQASPLLQGRVYAGMAEAWSKCAHESEAKHFLDLARRTFPEDIETDPAYSYTHFTPVSISTCEGLTYLNLRQPGESEQAFARVDRLVATDAVPYRLELMVHQAMLAYSQGELEQTGKLIELALPVASTLGSQLRADQMYEIYEGMLRQWASERVVKDLEGLFRSVDVREDPVETEHT